MAKRKPHSLPVPMIVGDVPRAPTLQEIELVERTLGALIDEYRKVYRRRGGTVQQSVDGGPSIGVTDAQVKADEG